MHTGCGAFATAPLPLAWRDYNAPCVLPCHASSRQRQPPRLRSATPSPKQDALPPGTTSLLIQLRAHDAGNVREWLHAWLRDFVFGAEGAMSVPVSVDTDSNSRALMLFYSSAGDVRGVLSLSADSCPEGVLIRATSASRFINPVGMYSATLPGERRVVRALFTDAQKRFGSALILFKPPYLRLSRSSRRGDIAAGGDVRTPITVFVAEVRFVRSIASVVSFLHSWGPNAQFGAGIDRGIISAAVAPPITTVPTGDGVRIFVQDGDDEGSAGNRRKVIIASAREKTRSLPGRKSYLATDLPSDYEQMGSVTVLVLVSVTAPEDFGSQAVLRRYEAHTSSRVL